MVENIKELLKKVSNYDLLEELRRRLLLGGEKKTSTTPPTKTIEGEIGEILTLTGQTGEYKLVKLTNLQNVLCFGEVGKNLKEGSSYQFEVREGKSYGYVLVGYSEII